MDDSTRGDQTRPVKPEDAEAGDAKAEAEGRPASHVDNAEASSAPRSPAQPSHETAETATEGLAGRSPADESAATGPSPSAANPSAVNSPIASEPAADMVDAKPAAAERAGDPAAIDDLPPPVSPEYGSDAVESHRTAALEITAEMRSQPAPESAAPIPSHASEKDAPESPAERTAEADPPEADTDLGQTPETTDSITDTIPGNALSATEQELPVTDTAGAATHDRSDTSQDFSEEEVLPPTESSAAQIPPAVNPETSADRSAAEESVAERSPPISPPSLIEAPLPEPFADTSATEDRDAIAHEAPDYAPPPADDTPGDALHLTAAPEPEPGAAPSNDSEATPAAPPMPNASGITAASEPAEEPSFAEASAESTAFDQAVTEEQIWSGPDVIEPEAPSPEAEQAGVVRANEPADPQPDTHTQVSYSFGQASAETTRFGHDRTPAGAAASPFGRLASALPSVSFPSPGTAGDARSYLRLAARIAAGIMLALASTILLLVVLYRWVDPPTSTLMLGQRLLGTEIEQQWVPLRRVAPNLVHAVILSEDGGFCRHRGVDWSALEEAIEDSRGGSTITMQVVKNLFLWPARSYVRKALEIVLAYVVEVAWPKERILEIYLNIAEWGPGVFGAEAAAGYHFGKRASQLTAQEAALLAVSLPSPIERRAGYPGWQTRRLAGNLLIRMRAVRTPFRCVRSRRTG